MLKWALRIWLWYTDKIWEGKSSKLPCSDLICRSKLWSKYINNAKYDCECEIFKNKDNIIQVNFVEQWINEIHLHLNKTYLTIEKNFSTTTTSKNFEHVWTGLVLGHTQAPQRIPTVALLVCLLRRSLERQVELHTGRMTNRRQDSHTGQSATPGYNPQPRLRSWLCA